MNVLTLGALNRASMRGVSARTSRIQSLFAFMFRGEGLSSSR
jgi:hypothetical protein